MHYPQYRAMDDAIRFYRRREADYNRRKLGMLACRMLAANEVLSEQTGDAHLAPGVVDALITVFQQFVPEKEEGNGGGT